MHHDYVPLHYDKAYYDPITLADRCIKALRKAKVDYDTIVVTGVSGMLIGPILAAFTNTQLVIVPKPDDTDNHRSSGTPIGITGDRWVFVDDFVATGRTHQRVKDAIFSVDSDTQQVALLEYNSDGCSHPKVTVY